MDIKKISNPDDPIEVIYVDKKGITFKKTFVFIAKIKSLSEIQSETELLDKDRLQPSEVDWASFLTKDQAEEKIFFRFKPLLNLI